MEKKIRQYLEGRLPKKGQEELLRWLRQNDNQAIYLSEKKKWWEQMSAGSGAGEPDYGQLRLRNRLKEKQHEERSVRHLKIYRYAAAVFLLVILAGSLLFVPAFRKTQEMSFTEVHTDSGQISGITLADGSRVWINSETKLRYNNRYGIDNRDVVVQGEAFFDVVGNGEIPFTVATGSLTVKVKGTQFGVSDYGDTNLIEVILEEGAVDVYSEDDKLLVQLLPEEKAIFDRTKRTIKRESVNPKHYTSWRNGIVHIFELPLEEVVMKLERRFNQRFEVDPAIKDLPLTFSIEKESLADVLYLMEKIASIKAIQERNTIKLKYEVNISGK